MRIEDLVAEEDTVKDLYVRAGQFGDWPLRRKIEEAVVQRHVVQWGENSDRFWEWYLYTCWDCRKEALW